MNQSDKHPVIAVMRTLDLATLRLSAGAHFPDHDFCVMEAVAYVAGEAWTDTPTCASTVLGAFLRCWNDQLDDSDRQMLVSLIPRLVGTAAPYEVEVTRAWMAVDWACRTLAPRWLVAAGLADVALTLSSANSVTDEQAVDAILPLLREGLRQARDARAAAEIGAGDAAEIAAGAAAEIAAGDAARAAVRAAAGYAAGYAAESAAEIAAGDAAWAAWAAGAAARAAAESAARAALRPVVMELQQSALDLLERMIGAGG